MDLVTSGYEIGPGSLGTFVLGYFTGVNGVDIGFGDLDLWRRRVLDFYEREGLNPACTTVGKRGLRNCTVLVLIVFPRGRRDSRSLNWVSRFRELCGRGVGVRVAVQVVRGGDYAGDLAGRHFMHRVSGVFDAGKLFPRMRPHGVEGVVYGYWCECLILVFWKVDR